MFFFIQQSTFISLKNFPSKTFVVSHTKLKFKSTFKFFKNSTSQHTSAHLAVHQPTGTWLNCTTVQHGSTIQLCWCYFLALLMVGSTHIMCMQDLQEGRNERRDLCIQLCVAQFFLHFTHNNEYTQTILRCCKNVLHWKPVPLYNILYVCTNVQYVNMFSLIFKEKYETSWGWAVPSSGQV